MEVSSSAWERMFPLSRCKEQEDKIKAAAADHDSCLLHELDILGHTLVISS